MILAGAFAIVLFVGLIVGDWMYFARLSSDASRYGYGIGRVQDRFAALTIPQLLRTFDQNGFLSLPHGVARVFPEANRMVIRPTHRLFSLRFRTAWPLKEMCIRDRNGHAQDWIKNVAPFSVLDADYYGTGKLCPPGWEANGVLVRYRWEAGETRSTNALPIRARAS